MPSGARARGVVGSLEQHATARRPQRARHESEQRRLACAVRPDHGVPAARLHLQGHVGHRPQRAEVPAQPRELEDRGHALAPGRAHAVRYHYRGKRVYVGYFKEKVAAMRAYNESIFRTVTVQDLSFMHINKGGF